MNRMTRNVAAAALAAAVALGASAPAAVAGPKSGEAKAAQKAGGRSDQAKEAKADRAASQLQRKVTKEATRKVAYLDRLAESSKVQGLVDAEVVALNIADDIAALEAEVAAVAAGSDVRAAAETVRSYRPENYHRIVSLLRLATELEATLATMPVALPEQAAALTELIEALLTFDATTSRAQLKEGQQVVAAVKEALESAETPAETPAEETPVEPAPDADLGTDPGFPAPDGSGLNS